ncbi:MAG: MFS transporter [Pseudomonadota bacterium]
MPITFIASSIITFLAMIFIIIVQSQLFTKNGRIYKVLKLGNIFEISIRQDVLIGISALLVCLTLSGIVILAFFQTLPLNHHLYEWHEFLTSQLVSSGLLGVIFGGFLATWIMRTYRKPADEKLTFVQKIEGIIILLLFVLGTTTITLEELIRSFSVRGGEFGFQLAANPTFSTGQESLAFKDANEASDESGNGATNARFMGGFGPIWLTKRAMSRDAYYLGSIRKALEKDATETSGGNPPNQEIRDARIEQLDASLALHKEVSDNFESSFNTLVNCVGLTAQTTKDQRYIFSLIEPLRPLIGALYVNLQNLDGQHDRKTVEAIRRINLIFKQFNETNSGVRAVADDIQTQAQLLGLQECEEIRVDGLYLPIRERASAILRPYLANIYASLLYMDGQKVQAFEVLHDAVQRIQESDGYKRAITDPHFGPMYHPEFWYLQRAMFNLIFMAEDFFETRNPSPPPRILELYLHHLLKYQEYLSEIDTDEIFASIFDNYRFDRNSNTTLVDTRFSIDPRFQKDCPQTDYFDPYPLTASDYATFAYLQLSIRAYYIIRSLDDNDFIDHHSKKTGHMANTIANVDLHCAEALIGIPKEALRQQRANFLHIYALHQEALIAGKRKLGSEYVRWKMDRLELVENSVRLATENLTENSNSTSQRLLSDLKLMDEQRDIERKLKILLNRTERHISLIQ